MFIVGMPRSGTTLVEQILSSHSKMAGAGELRDMTELVAMLVQKRPRRRRLSHVYAHRGEQDLREAADRFLGRLAKVGGGAARVIDKMRENFLHLGVIALAFPRARVIHCRRNPLDVCLSCYFQNFNHVNFAWSLEDLGQYHVEYERLMAHWHRCCRWTFWTLVTRTWWRGRRQISRELVAYCGLEWEDCCLAFHKNKRAVHTASAVQVRRPMYRRSIGRWQKYAAHLGPLREALQAAFPHVARPGDQVVARSPRPCHWLRPKVSRSPMTTIRPGGTTRSGIVAQARGRETFGRAGWHGRETMPQRGAPGKPANK